jgi:hypothetical protein
LEYLISIMLKRHPRPEAPPQPGGPG